MMRDAEAGLEVLLLRRNRRAGFVPGAYVFPGGRVDPSDAAPSTLARVDALTPEAAAERLDLPHGDPPAIAYYVAALREAFEETGIPVGLRRDPAAHSTEAEADVMGDVRDQLLEDRITFAEGLSRLGLRAAADGLEYLAHWITPVTEPRRYDARFFAVRAPSDAEAIVDAREMTASLWISPAQALREARAGDLPMILPTVLTLEQLAGYSSTEEALETLPRLTVTTILPRSDRLPPGG